MLWLRILYFSWSPHLAGTHQARPVWHIELLQTGPAPCRADPHPMVSLHVQKHRNVLHVAPNPQSYLQAAYGESWWEQYVAHRRSNPSQKELELGTSPQRIRQGLRDLSLLLTKSQDEASRALDTTTVHSLLQEDFIKNINKRNSVRNTTGLPNHRRPR